MCYFAFYSSQPLEEVRWDLLHLHQIMIYEDMLCLENVTTAERKLRGEWKKYIPTRNGFSCFSALICWKFTYVEKVFKLRVKIHEEPKCKSFNNPAERIMQKFQQFHNSSSSHYELIFVMNMFAYIFILPSIIRILPSTSHSHTKKLATHQQWKSSCKYFRIFPLLIACNFIFSVLYCSACITLNPDGAGSSSISEIKISLAIKRGSENKVSFIGE